MMSVTRQNCLTIFVSFSMPGPRALKRPSRYVESQSDSGSKTPRTNKKKPKSTTNTMSKGSAAKRQNQSTKDSEAPVNSLHANNAVESLAQNIAHFLMPQVRQQIESVLEAHGLLKQGEGDDLDLVSAEVASKITGKNLSSATNYLSVSNSLHIDNDFGDYVRLSDNVSDSLKSKIWANTFINFSELLPNKRKKGYANPGIIWSLQGQNQKLTIDQWTSAFNIFMAVYLEKEGNKHEAPFLCKNAEVVRELASIQGDWFKYDEQFRKNRARTIRGWGQKHNELYCKAIAWGMSNRQQQTNSNSVHKVESL